MTEAAAAAAPRIELDHLVVAARTIDEGAAWCAATLGVEPSVGGRHALMGTHNRLLAVGSPRFSRSYLEIVAIDPEAQSPARARWFELDQPALGKVIAEGPRLVHWVARSGAIGADSARLRAAGYDPGVATEAERVTPQGILRWRITLRQDGGRPAGGAVPLLIEWREAHPGDSLPSSGVRLERVELGGVPATLARQLGVDVSATAHRRAPPLFAVLSTPLGRVELAAPLVADH